MRSMKTAVISFIIFSMLGAVQITGCSHEDTAIVTINLTGTVLESRYQEKSFINKIFSFFVTESLAGSASPHNYQYDTITLTVQGDGMDTITAEIPPAQLTYSIEVPSGSGRRFTAVAYKTGTKNSGAHVITDLGSNQEVSISINMLPIVQSFSAGDGGGFVSMSWSPITGVTGYYIYRSDNPDGPYEKIITEVGQDTNYTSDYSTVIGKLYYYKICVYYPDREGELSDYKSASRSY